MATLDKTEIQALLHKLEQVQSEVAKAIVGQQDVVQKLMISLLAGGHCLLEGVPGLAKTLMVNALSQALDLSFNRVQFTPDLMLVDYQLDRDLLGLDLISDIQQKMHKVVPAAIVTALHDEALKQKCHDLNIMHLNKPLKPAKLRAMVQSMAKQQKFETKD
jgi:CheY-like chemotaxis protein